MSFSENEKVQTLRDEITALESKLEAIMTMRSNMAQIDQETEQLTNQKQRQKTLLDFYSKPQQEQSMSQSHSQQQPSQPLSQDLIEKRNKLVRQMEELRGKLEQLVLEKNMMLMRMEGGKQLADPAKKKKYIGEEEKKIQVQIASAINEREACQKGVESQKKIMENIEIQIKEKQEE